MKFEKCEAIRLATNEPGKFLEVELYYAKGGMNVFSYQMEKRGYYISATPVKIERGMRSFIAFSGRKWCVHECARKSAKAERKAVAEANDCIDTIWDMVKFVAKKNNLEVLNNEG